ncbi:MAG: hypothetical protein GX442_03105 [Candidatus Riflebacteria bacterium]|nr:hypothetical protein [Candidatus Riflebacteria bacterium]
MNCQDFQNGLDTRDPYTPSAEEQAHARTCMACRRKLEASRRLLEGLAVVRGCARVPDLAPRIRQAAAAAGPVDAAGPSLGDRLIAWVQFLAPTSPLKSSLFYAAAGSIIFVLLWAVLARVPPRTEGPAAAGKHAWQMTMLHGGQPTVTGPGGVAAAPEAGTTFPAGAELAFPPASRARFRLPGQAEVEVEGARLTLQEYGFRLSGGRAKVQVRPVSEGAPAFRVLTPLATVTVMGTGFTLELSERRLLVQVSAGRVQVEAGSGRKVLGPGEELRVGPSGWEALPGSDASSTVVPDSDRPEVPQD